MFVKLTYPRKNGSSIVFKYFHHPLVANTTTVIVDSEYIFGLGSESNIMDFPKKHLHIHIGNEIKINSSIGL